MIMYNEWHTSFKQKPTGLNDWVRDLGPYFWLFIIIDTDVSYLLTWAFEWSLLATRHPNSSRSVYQSSSNWCAEPPLS